MQVNKKSSLPPKPELWGDPGFNSDLASVMDLFLGKTNEDILPLLKNNYIIRCLDLNEMPDSVFEYYGIGFAEFLFRVDIDDERFGVLLGSFLDAASNRLDFWRHSTPLLRKFYDRIIASKMDEENKAELTEELDDIRARTLRP